MPTAPFDNVLSGLQKIDLDLLTRTDSIISMMSAMPTFASQQLILQALAPGALAEVSLAISGAKTASFNSATQANNRAQGAYIVLDIGVVSGTTPVLSTQLQWSPNAGGLWFNLGDPLPNIIASTKKGIIAIGPSNFSKTPGATPADLALGGDVQVITNAFLPRTWRLAFTITGTTPSFTFTGVYATYHMP